MPQSQNHTTERGFAAMDEDKQREIASKGGQSVPPEKRSFSRNHELASVAGRKGGEARAQGPSGKQEHHGQRSGSNGQHSETGQKGAEAKHERSSDGQRGGSSEQHARTETQSHKNN